MKDELETPRLYLRQFTPDDLDDLCPIFNNAEVVKFIKADLPVTREDTDHALQSMISHWERHGFGRWAVVEKETKRLIGYGGLRNLYGTPELVYLLDRPYWGKGLATEIAGACLKWGFETRSFEHIVAITRPEHAVSRRVMEKVGMTYEKKTSYLEVEVVQYTISRATYQSLSILNQIPFSCVASSNIRRPTGC